MQAIYALTPVVAEIISSHCPRSHARDDFMKACLYGDWSEVQAMVEGMLAEPWHLIGYQENRLRQFLALLQLEGTSPTSADGDPHSSSPAHTPSDL
jgi:hypothetical protein